MTKNFAKKTYEGRDPETGKKILGTVDERTGQIVWRPASQQSQTKDGGQKDDEWTTIIDPQTGTLKTGPRPIKKGSGENMTQSNDSADAISEFDQAVRQRLPRNRAATFEERQLAIAAVAKARPDLHRNYLIATNESKRARRMIAEKFDNDDVDD